MRCNRKTSGLAVTPHWESLIWALCYRDFAATPQSEIRKRKLLDVQAVSK
jgi:hypothetical protein